MISRLALFVSGLYLFVLNLIYPLSWFLLLRTGQLIWKIRGKEFPLTFTDKAATLWGLLQMYPTFALNRTKVKIEGLEQVKDYDGPMIVTMNHQSTFDIGVAYYLLWKMNRNLRWVLKKELLNVPFIGTACYETKCAFVDRKDRQKAEAEMLRFSEQLRRDGLSAVIFIEGTRATPRKMKKSDYKNLLNPRPMGISILRDQLPDWPMLNVTLDWVGKTGTTILNTSIWNVTLRMDCQFRQPEDVPEDFVKWLFEEEWPRSDALVGEWRREAGILPEESTEELSNKEQAA